jgi:hypothetical protein
MSTKPSLEERLQIVESEIRELREQLSESRSKNWLEQVTGSFQDEPAFEEVIAYGKAIRYEEIDPLGEPESNEE